MKIADIRTIALSYRCDPPYASAAGVQGARGALLVEIETDDGTIGLGEAGLEVRPYAGDPDPNGIIGNFPAALRHGARIAQPKIRCGWLERGPGPVRATVCPAIGEHGGIHRAR